MLTAEPNPADDRVILTLSKGDPRTFDAVVLAVPPRQVERILGDASQYGIANLEAYDAYPIVDVHLWHDGGSIGYDFVAALESPLQWIFEKAPGYLCCSISAAQQYLQMPTEALESLAWREVQTFLPALKDAKLLRSAVTRNPEATWLPRVGAARTAQATTHPASQSPVLGRIPAGPTQWNPPCAAAPWQPQFLLEGRDGLRSLSGTGGDPSKSPTFSGFSGGGRSKTSFFPKTRRRIAPAGDSASADVLTSRKVPSDRAPVVRNPCGAQPGGFYKSSPPKAGGRESSRRT